MAAELLCQRMAVCPVNPDAPLPTYAPSAAAAAAASAAIPIPGRQGGVLAGDGADSSTSSPGTAAALAAAANNILPNASANGGSGPQLKSPGGTVHSGPLGFGTPLQQLLSRFDFDKKSGVTHEELGLKLKEAGYKLEESEVERLAEVLDVAGRGHVSVAAFAAVSAFLLHAFKSMKSTVSSVV
jgi:hypothetical protein